MTTKERMKLEHMSNTIDSTFINEHSVEVGKLLSKEITKHLKKNGFEVKNKFFQLVKENGYPVRIEFYINNNLVSKFAYLSTSSCDKWLKNNKSLLQSLKECNEIAFDDRYTTKGRSFQEFLKEIKIDCMRQNMYCKQNEEEEINDIER